MWVIKNKRVIIDWVLPLLCFQYNSKGHYFHDDSLSRIHSFSNQNNLSEMTPPYANTCLGNTETCHHQPPLFVSAHTRKQIIMNSRPQEYWMTDAAENVTQARFHCKVPADAKSALNTWSQTGFPKQVNQEVSDIYSQRNIHLSPWGKH